LYFLSLGIISFFSCGVPLPGVEAKWTRADKGSGIEEEGRGVRVALGNQKFDGNERDK
jgi:hypothetical protein